MNSNLVLLAALVAIILGLIALGAVLDRAHRRRRQRLSPLSVDDLSDRADVNGSQLVRIAREIRQAAAAEQRELRRGQLLRWAAVLEQVAVEHLECINAISLDALQAVGSHAVPHLGEFGGNRRRNPPLKRVAAVLLKGVRWNA